MRLVSKLCLWLALAVFVTASVSHADDDKDKARQKASAAQIASLRANNPEIGTCDLGTAAKDLDGNNVRARLYNNGHLFWKSSGNVYTVPKEGAANSIFASGIWIGGIDSSDNLRFVGTDYGPFELWPGPLDDSGNPPASCSDFDRIYKVTRGDVENYDRQGITTSDLEDWPFELGAPVTDGDGDPNNYNLAGGDRPELLGEQVAWWVMNDAGNVKEASQTAPIGLEVQVTAFVFSTADALNNTTFYKYKLIHKGDEPLTDVYFGLWSDPDLGDATDDFVASDSVLGLGIVYNGDENDGGADGYGSNPPALAYDYFQGPLVPDTTGGTHVDPDGTEHPGMKRIQMSKFIYYNNDSSVQGNPNCLTTECYDYMRGIWRDGTSITFGGTGYGGDQTTNFMFPGEPAQRAYWTEENVDGFGSRNTPADRRFLMSSGPFELSPGDTQDIVYGIVWSQSVSRLASVAQLKFDDIFAQGAYNSNFDIPPPPVAPEVSVDVADQSIIIEWENDPASNNFLNKYDETSAFLVDTTPPDGNTTYTFEGYRILQYESDSDQEGETLVTYDVVNNVTTVVDNTIDVLNGGALITEVTAAGSDSGVQTFYELNNLTNGRTYYFGIQAYAYNPNSQPKIYASPVRRFSAIPAPREARRQTFRATQGTEVASVRTTGTGDSFGVLATVANPSLVTGAQYEVRIYDALDPDGDGDPTGGIGNTSVPVGEDDDGNIIYQLGYVFNKGTLDADTVLTLQTYDLINTTTGETVISGTDFIVENDKNVPFGQNLLTVDGVSFNVETAPADFKDFLMTANGAGPIVPPTGGSADFGGFPVPERPGSGQQVGEGVWFFTTGDVGGGASYSTFLTRSVRGGFDPVVPFDWEMRFTQPCYDAWLATVGTQASPEADPYGYVAGLPGSAPEGACWAYDRFSYVTDDGDTPVIVPYEIWNTGIATPDDPSDDYRMVPGVIDWDGDGYDMQVFDSGISGADNDPESDWTYWFTPSDESPGDAGYQAWVADLLSGTTPYNHGGEVFARTVVVNWNGGDVTADPFVIDQDMPEAGSIIRIETTKPLANGDVFVVDTAPFRPGNLGDDVVAGREDQTLSREDLTAFYQEQVGVVPNPYKGASSFEIGGLNDEVRFVNLPEQATIRVYTLDGTLIRTLVKNSAEPTFKWDLNTEADLPMASGMYLVHIDMKDFGEKVIKFGVVKKRIQLDLF